MVRARVWLAVVLVLASASAGAADGGLGCRAVDGGIALPAPFAPAPLRPLDAGQVASLEAAIKDVLEPYPAGLSVGVLHGEQAWFGAYGFADVGRKLPATPQTSYRMASITKSFTGVAVMQLVEAGRLGLDDEIQRAVPWFPEKGAKLTVRQLLAHLGGVRHYRGLASERIRRPVTTREALAVFEGWDLAFEPGSKFLYTSYGYNLLGAAIECGSGLGYADYLSRYLFGPLGMTASELERPALRTPRWAAGYAQREGRLEPAAPLDLSGRFAGGGTRSTVEDLIRFGRAMLDGALLTADSHRLMRTAQVTPDGRLTDYGLGFAVYPQRGHAVVAHLGGQAGTSTLLVMIPAEHFALALATNLEGQKPLLTELAHAVQTELLEGGALRRPIDAADPLDGLLHEGLLRIQSYGLAMRSLGRVPAGEAKLKESFARVSAMLSRAALARPEALQRIQDGHQPREGELFVEVGVAMAERIAKKFGPERLAEGRAIGPLAFFEDYWEACGEGNCPRLAEEVEQRIRLLGEGWKRANGPQVRTLRLSPAPDVEKLGALLRPALADAPVRPDLSAELVRAGLRLAVAKQWARSQALLMLAVDLYPRSQSARLALVDWALLQGQTDAARAKLREVAQQSPFEAEVLNQRAAALRAWGKDAAAKRMTELSRELFRTAPDAGTAR